MSTVTQALDDQIEKEVTSLSKLSEINSLNKVNKLKNYKYENIFMDNYGEHVYDKTKNLIGYKINESEYATIEVFYDENNLLCKKILIKNFNQNKLCFEGEALTT
jgi:hypothetical protein